MSLPDFWTISSRTNGSSGDLWPSQFAIHTDAGCVPWFVWRGWSLFGDVWRCLESGNQCICIVYISIYYIHNLWNVSKARSRFDVPVCHYVTVLFSPKCEIILELYHSITHQKWENLITRCFVLKITGEPELLFGKSTGWSRGEKKNPCEASRCFCLRLWVWDVGTLRGLCGEWCALDVFLRIYGKNASNFGKIWDMNQWQRTFERWLVLRYFSAKTKMTIEKRTWWFWKKTFLLRWHLRFVEGAIFYLFLIFPTSLRRIDFICAIAGYII